MISNNLKIPRRLLASVAAAAFGLAITAPAVHAQNSDVSSVTVSADQPMQHSRIGAPIENVTLSKGVQSRDLDLRTADGVRILQQRVTQAARTACNDMNETYPIETSDSPSCLATAVRSGMSTADQVIQQAREVATR